MQTLKEFLDGQFLRNFIDFGKEKEDIFEDIKNYLLYNQTTRIFGLPENIYLKDGKINIKVLAIDPIKRDFFSFNGEDVNSYIWSLQNIILYLHKKNIYDITHKNIKKRIKVVDKENNKDMQLYIVRRLKLIKGSIDNIEVDNEPSLRVFNIKSNIKISNFEVSGKNKDSDIYITERINVTNHLAKYPDKYKLAFIKFISSIDK